MADVKITALNGGTKLTAVAAGDLFAAVDISDTTEAATGTTKPVAAGDLLRAAGVINACSPQFGADPTGSADSTTAIQAAIDAASPGQVVGLPLGVYKTSATLTLPDYVTLAGLGPVRSFAIPTGNYGIGGLDLHSAVIKPQASFTGSAVIGMGSAGTTQHGGQQIRGITIDGDSLGGTVHGIYSQGYVAGVTLRDVLVWGVSGSGLVAANDGTASHNPCMWDVSHCKFSHCGAWGVRLTALADGFFALSEATGNTSGGWEITNGNDARFTACRGESNSSVTGWSLIGLSGFTGYVSLTGCAADFNGTGFALSGTGTGTYILNGCVARGNTSAQWSYSGTNTIETPAAWNTSTTTPTLS